MTEWARDRLRPRWLRVRSAEDNGSDGGGGRAGNC